LAPVALACTVAIDSGRVQCSSDKDCTQRGGAFAGAQCLESTCHASTSSEWSCLGSVVWPSASSGSVTATLNLKDLVTQQPIVGVSARVCRKLDTTCAQPIGSDVQSDAAGKVVLQVVAGFDGYVELKMAGAMPGIYFFYPPLNESREVPFVPILSLSALSTFAGLVGGQVSPDRGHVLLGAYNCLHNPSEGVRFSSPDSDALTFPFYMIKGIPSATAAATDSQGYGGILNLRPGSVTLAGGLLTGETIGTEGVLTRAGELTYTTMLPAPR